MILIGVWRVVMTYHPPIRPVLGLGDCRSLFPRGVSPPLRSEVFLTVTYVPFSSLRNTGHRIYPSSLRFVFREIRAFVGGGK